MTDSPLTPAAPCLPTAAIPAYADLAADPQIAALLAFTPVPRKVDRHNGWSPTRQREFIAYLAWCGIPSLAAKTIDKNLSGIAALYKLPAADSFRAAWDAALELGQRRQRKPVAAPFPGAVPGIAPRGNGSVSARAQPGPLPGQVLNERGEWEDEAALAARGAESADSVRTKLLRCRRHYLMEISGNAGKRAAFEILTGYPIDWDQAAKGEPQVDEPYNPANQRQPDMVLTAESGWSFGEWGYGPDRKAELRAAVDEYRAAEGRPPVDWSESAER